jgi:excisionase family DNA binding protein
MAGLSLREAAQQAGTSKSTILRAVKAGRLSAARTDDGGYSIDPAELFRVYPPESRATKLDPATARSVGQDAPADATCDMTELRIRNAALEAELNALKEILTGERRRAEEIREDRERWHTQAERLALIAPTKPVSVVPEVKGGPAAKKASFRWFKRAA